METHASLNLQIRFLNRIKHILGSDKSLAYELSDILQLSTDSVYRRLRGETKLTTEEIALLCQHFNISFDVMAENTQGKVTFQYSTLIDVDGYIAYWVNMLNNLKQIASASEKQIIYASVDIPIFHHFNYPELTSFKLFYWLREVMNDPMLANSKFDLDWMLPELVDQIREIYTVYTTIPSTEIWTESTVISLVKQIEYYWDTDLFKDKELALKVIDRSIEELETIFKQAGKGSKLGANNTHSVNYKFYLSDIEIGNNCAYAVFDNEAAVYMGLLTFNTMVTNNKAFCNETDAWMAIIIRKSTLLSGVAEKQRYQFSKTAIKHFEVLRNKVLGHSIIN